MSYEITTITSLRRACRECDLVLARIRFGSSESWVKIAKQEALSFLEKGYGKYDTPEGRNMTSGIFGEVRVEDGKTVLYLG